MKHYAHTLRRDFLLSACVCVRACVRRLAGQGSACVCDWKVVEERWGGCETETKQFRGSGTLGRSHKRGLVTPLATTTL